MCPWQDLGKQTKSHKGFTPFLNSFARIIPRGFSALLSLEPLKFIATMKNATVCMLQQNWNREICLIIVWDLKNNLWVLWEKRRQGIYNYLLVTSLRMPLLSRGGWRIVPGLFLILFRAAWNILQYRNRMTRSGR